MARNNNGKGDVYEIITNDLIERIEANGYLPWQKPWNGVAQWPRNAATGRAYNGINVLILWMYGHTDTRYATYKQAQAAGGNVRKGAKGIRVVYWNIVERKDKETGEIETAPILRYYTVFNVADIENAEWKTDATAVEVEPDGDAYEIAFATVNGMPNRPHIAHDGGDRAYYIPAQDEIHMPALTAFETAEGYAETLYHEAVHATGHDKRLARHIGEGGLDVFGTDRYAREELVAEIGAAFLMATTGIDNEHTRNNNAAYVKGWVNAIREDNKAIIYAAARAGKAANYILNDAAELEVAA